jgi:nucleoid DNA-binding protein
VARPKVKGAAADFGNFGLKQKRARIGRRKEINRERVFYF